MDELINAITSATGVAPERARRAAGIIIAFLAREGPRQAVDELLDALPGSRDLAKEAGGRGRGLMGVFGDLTGAGLGMGDIQGVATALVTYARAKAGAASVDAVMAGIPGLAAFL